MAEEELPFFCLESCNPVSLKKMGRQTLKEHQSHKRRTRPTPTEEEGRGALRGMGWDRLFTEASLNFVENELIIFP